MATLAAEERAVRQAGTAWREEQTTDLPMQQTNKQTNRAGVAEGP